MRVNCVNCGRGFRTFEAYQNHWCEEMAGDPSDFGDTDSDGDGGVLVADGSGETTWFVSPSGQSAHRDRDCVHIRDADTVDTLTTTELQDAFGVNRCSDCGYTAPILGDSDD